MKLSSRNIPAKRQRGDGSSLEWFSSVEGGVVDEGWGSSLGRGGSGPPHPLPKERVGLDGVSQWRRILLKYIILTLKLNWWSALWCCFPFFSTHSWFGDVQVPIFWKLFHGKQLSFSRSLWPKKIGPFIPFLWMKLAPISILPSNPMGFLLTWLLW